MPSSEPTSQPNSSVHIRSSWPHSQHGENRRKGIQQTFISGPEPSSIATSHINISIRSLRWDTTDHTLLKSSEPVTKSEHRSPKAADRASVGRSISDRGNRTSSSPARSHSHSTARSEPQPAQIPGPPLRIDLWTARNLHQPFHLSTDEAKVNHRRESVPGPPEKRQTSSPSQVDLDAKPHRNFGPAECLCQLPSHGQDQICHRPIYYQRPINHSHSGRYSNVRSRSHGPVFDSHHQSRLSVDLVLT